MAYEKSPLDVKIQTISNIASITKRPATSSKCTDTVSSKPLTPAAQHHKSSRLPISTGRKSTTITTREHKIGLQNRKYRDSPKSCAANSHDNISFSTEQPTLSRFPQVPAPSQCRSPASTAGPARCCGPPVLPFRTTLPPIRPLGGTVGGGRSRIPVRTRSADCRTGRERARRSALSSGCSSDGDHQASRRSGRCSARSGSCGSEQGHQASRRSGSSSCGSEEAHQTSNKSRRLAARSSSCDSASTRQTATCRPPLTSVWSMIDVNDNARLLLEGKTSEVIEREFHGPPATDLIVFEEEHKQAKQNTPSLPHVEFLRHQAGSAALTSSAAGYSLTPERSPGSQTTVPPLSPSPSNRRPDKSQSQQRRDSGPVTAPVGLSTQRRAADLPPGVPGARRSSQRVSDARRLRPQGYRPNLTPYPRQYILLGLLGPDPDRVKSRQDKMRRHREYAERWARLNRAAAQRRVVVPLRTCSPGPHRAPPNSETRELTQSTQDSPASQRSSSKRMVSRDSSTDSPYPDCEESLISSTPERILSPPGEHQLTTRGRGETHSPAPHDSPSPTLARGGRDSIGPDSDSGSMSEAVSESSLTWGTEEAAWTAEESMALIGEVRKMLEEANNRAKSEEELMSSGEQEIVEKKTRTEEERQGIEEDRRREESERQNNAETEVAGELGASVLRRKEPEVVDTMPACEMKFAYPIITALQGRRQALAPDRETETLVVESETVTPSLQFPKTDQPDLPSDGSDEGSIIETWTAEPGWVSMALAAEKGPIWTGLRTSRIETAPELSVKSGRIGMLHISATSEKENELSPKVNYGYDDLTSLLYRQPKRKSGSVSDSDSDSDSSFGSGSDSSLKAAVDSDLNSRSDSDSEAEMVDAREELSVTSLHPNPPPPPPSPQAPSPPQFPPLSSPLDVPPTPLPNGNGMTSPARRCRSDDVVLELPEKVPARVTAGGCRDTAAGCSCSLPARRPHTISRATQVPSRASFVYKNLLVMDLGAEGGILKTVAVGTEEWKGSKGVEGSGETGTRRETWVEHETMAAGPDSGPVSGAGPQSEPRRGAGSETVSRPGLESEPELRAVLAPGPKRDTALVPGLGSGQGPGMEPESESGPGPCRRRRWDSRLWLSPFTDELPVQECHYSRRCAE